MDECERSQADLLVHSPSIAVAQLLLVLNVLFIYLQKHTEINNQQMPLQAEKYQRRKKMLLTAP